MFYAQILASSLFFYLFVATNKLEHQSTRMQELQQMVVLPAKREFFLPTTTECLLIEVVRGA